MEYLGLELMDVRYFTIPPSPIGSLHANSQHFFFAAGFIFCNQNFTGKTCFDYYFHQEFMKSDQRFMFYRFPSDGGYQSNTTSWPSVFKQFRFS